MEEKSLLADMTTHPGLFHIEFSFAYIHVFGYSPLACPGFMSWHRAFPSYALTRALAELQSNI